MHSGVYARLLDIPGFASLDGPALGELAATGDLIERAIGSTIFEQGEIPAALDILLEGMVELAVKSPGGESAVVDVVEPVECLAFAAVWLRAPYLVTARALRRSSVFRISADVACDLLSRDGAVVDAVARSLCGQYRSAIGQIADLKLRSVAQRLGRYLVVLVEKRPGRREMILPYEKRVLAARLGTSAEHLSRAFGTLRLYGVVTHGSRVQVVDLERLKAFAGVGDPVAVDRAQAWNGAAEVN